MSLAQPISWQPDILGDGFASHTIELGKDPDGQGDVYATLVRYQPEDSPADRPAILWLHGLNDYFFQAHVAKAFHEAGYAFYALDLRKCGRSRRDGQDFHYTTDFRQYFEELGVAGEIIGRHHSAIVPLAHSTAGMIAPLWLQYLQSAKDPLRAIIPALILNGPWLAMMGFPPAFIKYAGPLVSAAGKLAPRIPVPGGTLSKYGRSLHSSHDGEFDYDLGFKAIETPTKYLGWLREVLVAQKAIDQGRIDAGVPILVLCSQRSSHKLPFGEETHTSDAVVDVEQTREQAPKLASDVEIVSIDNARHDIFLSRQPALDAAYDTTFTWLDRVLNKSE